MIFILWIALGALIGWTISRIIERTSPPLAVFNVAIGVFSSLVGGWYMSFIAGTSIGVFNLYSFAVALGAAVVCVLAVQMVRST